jgi:hypothetical protein
MASYDLADLCNCIPEGQILFFLHLFFNVLLLLKTLRDERWTLKEATGAHRRKKS